MKRKASKQLALWDDTTSELLPASPDIQQAEEQLPPDLSVGDIQEMRAQLLKWGERYDYPGFGFPFHYPPRNEDEDRRFGGLSDGKALWEKQTREPYAQTEKYPGEWLLKCLEHIQRFERGIHSMPWKEFSLYELPSTSRRDDGEE